VYPGEFVIIRNTLLSQRRVARRLLSLVGRQVSWTLSRALGAATIQRLLRNYVEYAFGFPVDPTFFTVLDSYGSELLYPSHEGCTKRQIRKKGKPNERRIGCISGSRAIWRRADCS
jgi:hypothetical protein